MPERAPGEIDLVDVIGDELGADMGRLLGHLLHEPGALDHIGEARIVLDVGGGGELAAGLDALDQHRLEHGAGGIDRRRVARRSRPDDERLWRGWFSSPAGPSVETGAEGTIARLEAHDQMPGLQSTGHGGSGKGTESGRPAAIRRESRDFQELCKIRKAPIHERGGKPESAFGPGQSAPALVTGVISTRP